MSYLFTVLIASYNRLDYLKDCLSSVLAQEFENFEVLIVDDGSEAETVQWLKNLEKSEYHVNVIYQTNKGVATSRQVGLENAKGDYVCILDSDDQLVEGALQKFSEILNEMNRLDLILSNNIEIYPNGSTRYSNYPIHTDPKKLARAIISRPRVPFKHSGTIFRRELATSLGGYDKNLPLKIDIDFILKLLNCEPNIFTIKEPTIKFNFHPNSISRNRRMLGIKVWTRIIKKYETGNLLMVYFSIIKRALSEIAKSMYEQVKLR